MKITNEQSRVLHLNSLMLWEGPGKIKALEVIKKMSYLQIDAIYSIARSQDIVLHNRTTLYQEKDVWKLLEEKKLFEGFAHARCLIPIEDLPFYYCKMLRKRESVPQWYQSVSEELDWQAEILETARINEEIAIKDITIPENFPRFTGWNQAPKRMLDYLSTRGYLFSSKREKFQSFYKLPELQFKNFDTIVPNLPSREEEFLFHIKSTLRAIGPSPLHRLLHYKYIHSSIELNGKKISPRTIVSEYTKDGILTEIKVEAKDGKHVTYFCLPDQSDMITDLPQKDRGEYNCFFLSPFDNALWSRESLLAQYNFDYKMEVYVPKVKRVYGFFTLPILFGPDFIGRVDVKLERKDEVFHFLTWSWEKNFKQIRSKGYFWKALADTIERMALFHKVDKADLGNLSSSYKNKIRNLVDIMVR